MRVGRDDSEGLRGNGIASAGDYDGGESEDVILGISGVLDTPAVMITSGSYADNARPRLLPTSATFVPFLELAPSLPALRFPSKHKSTIVIVPERVKELPHQGHQQPSDTTTRNSVD